jgi:Mycothiol maleylpyruvate isomerase N-terminal domain
VGGKFVTTDVIGSSALGDLLQDSVNYARRTVRAVTCEELSHPTPCREWDLRALLNHLNDSLRTLSTARRTGRVGLDPFPPAGAKDDTPLATFDKYSAAGGAGDRAASDRPARSG